MIGSFEVNLALDLSRGNQRAAGRARVIRPHARVLC